MRMFSNRLVEKIFFLLVAYHNFEIAGETL